MKNPLEIYRQLKLNAYTVQVTAHRVGEEELAL